MAELSVLQTLNENTASEPGMRKWDGKVVPVRDPEFVRILEQRPHILRSMGLKELREAIGADAFDTLTLDRMHRRLLKGWQEWDPQWKKVVSHVASLADFRTRYAVQHGSFDRLPEVQPSGAYLEQTFSDTRVTYTPAKHGSLFAFTFEAKTYDDLGMLDAWAQKFGAAARRTIDYYVFFALIDSNPTIYDGKALFDPAAHSNVVSAVGLNYDNLKAAYELMLQQTDIDSNAALIIPKFLVVHPAEYLRALELVDSALRPDGANNAVNVFRTTAKLEVIVTPYITSTNWYLVADPARADTIEIGLWQGREEPELFVENAQSGHAFEFDEIRYKVRLIFGGAVLDYRTFVRGTTA